MKILQERFYPSARRVLALAGEKEDAPEYLVGYDVDGNQVFHVPSPEGYSFLYLCSHTMAEAAVVCGFKEADADGCWPDYYFAVDHESGKLNRICKAR
ncbi:hypothetical protein SLL00_05615 [Metabacillus indicus]|uniref:hypothetical protein n=1 Tax=Metabacillus indicus TaxID=246786 RepID=UPI002A0827EC|nr:hypothetical protein [Metabacillus indicus]MDX8289258.1 hypothetical protein [Metabacillus indicus]